MKNYTTLEQKVYQTYYEYCSLLSVNVLANELFNLSVKHWNAIKEYTNNNNIRYNDIKIIDYANDICNSIFGKYEILSIDDFFNLLLQE